MKLAQAPLSLVLQVHGVIEGVLSMTLSYILFVY